MKISDCNSLAEDTEFWENSGFCKTEGKGWGRNLGYKYPLCEAKGR